MVPLTEYIRLVWETLSLMTTGSPTLLDHVELEDIHFVRVTTMVPGQQIELTIMVNHGSGRFEITEKSTLIGSGIVRRLDDKQAATEPPAADSADDCAEPLVHANDLYKEFWVRGYHYRHPFTSLETARGDSSSGTIRWQNNWSAFLDCMLQMCILAKDTRNTLLPTRARRITLSVPKHRQALRAAADAGVLRATHDPLLNVIRCGGAVILGAVVKQVERRKAAGLEVLSAYRFLPLVPDERLTSADAVRVVVQVIVESAPGLHRMRVLEVAGGAADPLIPAVERAVAETPLLKAEYTLLTGQTVSLDNVRVVPDWASATVGGQHLVVVHDAAAAVLDQLAGLDENAFLLLCQPAKRPNADAPAGFTALTAISTENGALTLLQKRPRAQDVASPTVIEVPPNDHTYRWLAAVQTAVQSGPVLLYAQGDPHSGLLGLVNCLRREPDGDRIRCVIVMDARAPKFAVDHPLYAAQLAAGLAVNIYENGVWGTYRFVQLANRPAEVPRTEHVYANVRRLGDLTSFEWFGGPAAPDAAAPVSVHYASINFRDVMVASGRLPISVCRAARTDGDCVLGLEFAGVAANGDRVMGMVRYGAMASHVQPVQHMTWTVPERLSLRDAATIPAVYVTVYYALFVHRPVARGHSILIHAGSGGIGLAAIRVALAYGLEVFTTVSTEQKRRFILGVFPQLKGWR